MRVYMDNAATTPLKKEVLEEMMPYFCEKFGNASSIHSYGREAHQAIDLARTRIAQAINAKEQEIYFTSGGTESDNTAIMGVAAAHGKKGKHIITSAIEHHAVLHTCRNLEKKGYDVTYIMPDEKGILSSSDVEKAIRKDTILITTMFANNEIGTIQPIAEIGEIAHKHGIIFHTDAVQAIGSIPIDVEAMNIDMLSMSAHKIGGPKGVGALYVRKGIRFEQLMHGGAQERDKRPGTSNVPGIVGLGKAIELIFINMDERCARVAVLRDKLIDGILSEIPYTYLNGDRDQRLCGNVNVSIEFVEGEALLLHLDMKGISASSGSACTSGSLDPSHVLLAIGLSHEIAHGSLRLSLNSLNTQEEVDYVINELKGIVELLRNMSPLFAQHEGGRAYV
ncbi:MAG: cysteine desulfurase NifS [Christensenellales bacterium]|jgi:cysteine desulfurase